MILRESGLPDLESMAKIIDSCQAVQSLESGLDWNKESLRNAIIDTEGRVLGAYLAEMLVGFILFKELMGPADEGEFETNAIKKSQCIEIWCLATLPAQQGKGVMSALLRDLKLMTDEIWLEVHESNLKAINFYINQEFQQVGIRSSYYKDGKDAWLFTWKSEKRVTY